MIQCPIFHELHPFSKKCNDANPMYLPVFSAILINLGPDLLDMVPLLLRYLPIHCRSVEPLCPQAEVDFVFCVRAVSEHFPHESTSVTLFQDCDHIAAV
jgi:hypothetical protein